MKSRLPPVNENEITENRIPKAAPIATAAKMGTAEPVVENSDSSSPTKSPNHMPEASPATATRE